MNWAMEIARILRPASVIRKKTKGDCSDESSRVLLCRRQETTLRFHAKLSKVSADDQTLRDVPRNDGPNLRLSDKWRRELRKPST